MGTQVPPTGDFLPGRSARRLWFLALAALIGLFPHGGSAESAGATWTRGHRKILVIPVSFTDAGGPSNSDVRGFTGWADLTNGTAPAAISNFFTSQSYGQFSVDFTILPVVPLGVSTNYYTNTCPGTPDSKWTAWAAPGSLADDARARAREIGLTNGQAARYESAGYDFDIIATGYIPGQSGSASDGGRSVIAFNYFTALAHELCHGLGLQHANGYSRATYASPVKSGSYFWDPYGDVYCLMGYKANSRTAFPPPDRDANPFFKYELGWLTTHNICTPLSSGTYRIHAFDQGTLQAGSNYALRISRDSSYTYWFSFRQAITNGPDSKWSQNGLEVRYGADSPRASSGATVLWDMTPGSRGPTGLTFSTMYDAPLAVGRTYTDAGADLHVTPLRKGGTAPESLDVAVNWGPFPGNQAPAISLTPSNVVLGAGTGQLFTATALDPDGDTLTYYWEFDDYQTSGGTDFGGLDGDSRLATNGFHVWSQQGTQGVRCTVSDLKGHTKTASATVIVTNGLPPPITLSGVIRDEGGIPLEGALVNNYRSGVAYGAPLFAGSSATAADGKYQIAVPASNKFYNVSVLWQGYSFTNSIGCTISTQWVGVANVGNVNFTRQRLTRTISGGVYVGGHAYVSATYGDLWVSDGLTNILVTNGAWQLSVPDGTWVTLTATATPPAYTISSDFPKPYRVVDDCNTLHFFVTIPGQMPVTEFTTSGTQSDDTVGTVYIPVVMTLPPGMTNWGGDQVFHCTVDERSTAEYGVDYKLYNALITFYGEMTPVPYLIPLTVISNAVPKHKTLVLKLWPGSSLAHLGPQDTYTYTISNGFPPISARVQTGDWLDLTWSSVSGARYTVESTPTLTPAAWSNLPPHTNLPGSATGSMTRPIDIRGMRQGLFRVKVE